MIRISGIVRLPSDLDSGIDAIFQIVNDRLRLTTGKTELGSWPLVDVGVSRLSTETFRLDIAGEVIHFVPSNPDLFASLQFVDEAVRPTSEKKRPRRSRKVVQPTPTPRPTKESPIEAMPVVETVEEPETIEVDLTDEKVVSSGRRRRLLSRTRYLGAATRDQLRQTGIWPLDRLKALSADDSLPEEHTHKYERVTTQAGIVRRVCTECGHVSFLPLDELSTEDSDTGGESPNG